VDTIGTDSTDTLFDHYLPPKGWGDIATKQDLASLGTELRGEIAQLRGEMHGEIGNLRAEMHNAFRVQTYALVMLIVALVGILIGLQQAGITR
jgi:hypothetical protein